MGKVLCATRGGEGSAKAQDAAIALALESGSDLVFLYVADASFLDQIAAPVVVDVESVLERMGRFQLGMAAERAMGKGVNAQCAVRHGRLREELAAAARELGVTLIVLGRPGDEAARFDREALDALASDLSAKTGVEVRIF